MRLAWIGQQRFQFDGIRIREQGSTSTKSDALFNFDEDCSDYVSSDDGCCVINGTLGTGTRPKSGSTSSDYELYFSDPCDGFLGIPYVSSNDTAATGEPTSTGDGSGSSTSGSYGAYGDKNINFCFLCIVFVNFFVFLKF